MAEVSTDWRHETRKAEVEKYFSNMKIEKYDENESEGVITANVHFVESGGVADFMANRYKNNVSELFAFTQMRASGMTVNDYKPVGSGQVERSTVAITFTNRPEPEPVPEMGPEVGPDTEA